MSLNADERHTNIMRWQAFKKADRRAFEEIYRNNFSDLQQYGLSICHDSEHVLDAIHTLFFDLWVHKEQLSDTDNIRFYLFKGLRRVITQQLVKQRKSRTASPWITTEVSYETKLVEAQTQKEVAQKLKDALEKLSPRQREIIFLKFYKNLSNEEIASLTSLKVRTVYNTVYQALESMRLLITQEIKWFVVLILQCLT